MCEVGGACGGGWGRYVVGGACMWWVGHVCGGWGMYVMGGAYYTRLEVGRINTW